MKIDPDKCNQEIFKNGNTVAVIVGISPKELDNICDDLSIYSGQPVDWHFCGGRAVVRTLGNVNSVRQFLPQIYITD